MNDNLLQFSSAIARACGLHEPAVQLWLKVSMQNDVMPEDVAAAQALVGQPPPPPQGRKFALCIGVNRYGGGNDLKGCLNDCHDWTAELRSRGFTAVQLMDAAASRANILASLREMVGKLASGDTLVASYSGHGTQIRTNDPTEPDGKDECWVPSDFGRAGLIRDNDLADIFTTAAAGSQIIVLSDSCNSGSMTRDADGAVVNRFLDPEIAGVAEPPDMLSERAIKPRDVPSVILLSGCADHETSADAHIGGRYCGAMSYHALAALNAKPTWEQWHRMTVAALRQAGFRQTPQLTCPEALRNERALA